MGEQGAQLATSKSFQLKIAGASRSIAGKALGGRLCHDLKDTRLLLSILAIFHKDADWHGAKNIQALGLCVNQPIRFLIQDN